jgi:uncharacterized protein
VTRAVIDPGVLVSAFIGPHDSVPDRIVRTWYEGAFELLVSPHLLAELTEVLARPKFQPQASFDRVRAYVGAFAAGAVLLQDPPETPGVTQDPDDEYLFALARAGRAEVIVSGDKHLTELVGAKPPVIAPREFLGRLT